MAIYYGGIYSTKSSAAFIGAFTPSMAHLNSQFQSGVDE
jgi:hypothetical protein